MLNKSILIVEDDSILRLTVSTQIKRLKYLGVTVINGREAIDQIKNNRFAMVLMDVQMPVLSGLEATREIREWEKTSGSCRIPIIAITANPNREQCFEAGMDDFLFKPFPIKELGKLINKWAIPDTQPA